MTRVLGIDLGTTNSCVAVFDGTRVRVLTNEGGYPTTPSVVSIAEDGRVLVGQRAQRQAVTQAKHTAYAVKRLLGRSFQSEEVQHARAHVGYSIVPGPGGDPRIVLRGREYSCPEIGAFILTEMRLVAERALGERVDKAVVTVPAYFDDHQRKAVRDAGAIAGLDVVRIVNEPTAAALAYGFGGDQTRTIAVYDLGGGTFDISIVRCSSGGRFEVLATTGDSFLGGEDFDERIMKFLLDAFEAEHGVSIRKDPLVIQRVREASAKAKCDVSTLTATEVELPFLANGPSGPLTMHYEVTREAVESLCWELVQRTIDISEHALASIRLDASAIDEVVLVGGMTRMPLVEARVGELFGRTPSRGVHPDEAVAIGAALTGASIAEQIAAVSLEDVTSRPIGIGVAGDRFAVLIPANSRVPCKVTRKLTTFRDDQTSVRVRVLQGESTKASENELLHEADLVGLPKGKAGSVTIEVTFAIDAEGLFQVTGRDVASGREVHVDITGDSGLSEDEIDRLAKDHAKTTDDRRNRDAYEGLRQSVETTLAEVRSLVAAVERAGRGQRGVVISARDRAAEIAARFATYGRADLVEILTELEQTKSDLDALR